MSGVGAGAPAFCWCVPCQLAGATLTRRCPAVPRSEDAAVVLPDDPEALASLLGVPPDSLFAAGLERYHAEAYDSARAIWRVEALRSARRDSVRLGRTLMWLGLASWKLGDYDQARAEGTASLELKRRLGLDGELSRSYNALGLVAWQVGRYHDALAAFDSAAASARRNADTAGVVRAMLNLPLVQVELGDYRAARDGFEAALASARLLGNEQFEANALANLAMLEVRVGDPTAAILLLSEARGHYRQIGYQAGEANALGQLATAWGALGDLQQALAAADSGLELARAEGLTQEVAATLEVLADLHLQAGSPRLALARLRDADSIDAALGLPTERGNNLRRTSAILLQLGAPSAAMSRAAGALALHRSVLARAEAVLDRLQLAQALAAGGQRGRARAEAEAALRESEATGNPSIVGEAAAVAAQLALEEGRPALALEYASRRSLGDPPTNWVLPDLRAGALLALGRLAEARIASRHAVAALERERASLSVGPLRSAYLIGRADPFARLTRINLALGDTSGAFAIAAMVPGRALAERLGGMPVNAGPLSRVAAGERLLREGADLEQELAGLGAVPGEEERRNALQGRLAAVRSAFEEYQAHHPPAFPGPLPASGLVGLDEVQAALKPGEALVTFLVSTERVDAFLVTDERVAHEHIPAGAVEVAGRVRLVRELLGRGSLAPPVLEALGGLRRLLLGGFESAGLLDGVRQLSVVPHGALSALPFSALWDPQSGRFLIQDMTVVYLPTVRAQTTGANTTSWHADHLAAFAPLPDSLPGTRREVRALVRNLPGATGYVGRRSTETLVRAALLSSRAVHIASHGSYNPVNPLFSRVTVGAAIGAASASDGKLGVYEILQLRVNSPFVFLSGCETGLVAADQEPFTRNIEEGGLAQAFLAAGAGTVVATLWPVRDDTAVPLALAFYGHLSSGLSPAEALARVQRQLIKDVAGPGWAAYTVMGRGNRKPAGNVRGTRAGS